MGSVALTMGQGATASATFTDAQGAHQVPATPPVWSSSDDAIAGVAAAPDGLTAIITAVAPGGATIHCSATNPDGTSAIGSGNVTVSAPAVNTDIANIDVEFVAS